MNIQSQESEFNDYPSDNSSPVYIEEGNLYLSATEWDRLCCAQSTDPLVTVLSDVRGFLARGKSVRLIGLDGGIAVSADRQSDFQAILDNANRRRSSMGLAPAIPLD